MGYVAAPVLGRPDVAAAGKLTILLAGPRQAVESVQPLLEGTVGQKVWRFGERASQANVVKLAVNFMLAAAMESMGEAAALTEGYGVEARELFELIGQSLFPGPVYQGYGRLIAEGRFEPRGSRRDWDSKTCGWRWPPPKPSRHRCRWQRDPRFHARGAGARRGREGVRRGARPGRDAARRQVAAGTSRGARYNGPMPDQHQPA